MSATRYLVFSDVYPDGRVMSRLEYLREILRARRCKETLTCIEIAEDAWHAMNAVVNEASAT